MKLKVSSTIIELIPESNEDWFDAGRIIRNLGLEVKKTNQRLTPELTNIEIPLNVALKMLAEGVFVKKEAWQE